MPALCSSCGSQGASLGPGRAQSLLGISQYVWRIGVNFLFSIPVFETVPVLEDPVRAQIHLSPSIYRNLLNQILRLMQTMKPKFL